MIAVFERDFLSFVRAKRFFVLRSAVVALPLALMICVVTTLNRDDERGLATFWSATILLLGSFFFVSPGLCAHVLAEERRAGKLDVLRSSPLSVAALVWAKWLSRVAILTTVWIAGLPILAISLVFGGVSAEQFVNTAIVLYGTILWTSAVAMAASSGTADLGRAARAAYFACVTWVLVTGVLAAAGAWMTAEAANVGQQSELGLWLSMTGFTLNPAIAVVSAGAGTPARSALIFGLALPVAYGLASLGLAGALLLLAARRMRREPAARGGRTPAPPAGAFDGTTDVTPAAAVAAVTAVRRPRPLVWTRPMLWLELEGQGKAAPWKRLLVIVLVLVFEGIWTVVYLEELTSSGAWRSPARFVEYHLTAFGVLLGLGLIGVTAAGASVFQKDNQAKTQEVLFAAPLSSEEIVKAKAAGVLRGLWWIAALMVYHALFGAIAAREPATFFVLMLATAVAWTMIASMGLLAMRVSVRVQSPAKALARAFVALLAVTVFIPGFLTFLAAVGRAEDEALFLLAGYHPYVLTFVPIFEGLEQSVDIMNQDGAFFLPFWYLVHLVWAWWSIGRGLPALYAERREDRGAAACASPTP